MNQTTRVSPVLDKVQDVLRLAYQHHQPNQALPAFFDATLQLSVSNLDYWERAFRNEIELANQPRYLFGFKIPQIRKERDLIPWLDCCSGDGYQREQALEALSYESGAPNSFLLALLIRRLNDWVPEVRTAAREHIPKIAERSESQVVTDALWGVLPNLHTWGRLQIEEMNEIVNLLGIQDVLRQLSENLIQMTAGPAPSILEQAGRQPAIDEFLPEIAERAIQPAVRAKAYKSQLAGYATWLTGYRWVWTDKRYGYRKREPAVGRRKVNARRPHLEILDRAARDRSPLVRRVAGDELIAHLDKIGVEGEAIAQRLAKDAYPSIAERGVFALKHIKN